MSKELEKRNTPSRQKYWDELDDPGKIERLRQIIKQQESVIDKMAGFLDQLISHEHLNGRIVHPIEHPNQETYGKLYYKRHRSEEYF